MLWLLLLYGLDTNNGAILRENIFSPSNVKYYEERQCNAQQTVHSRKCKACVQDTYQSRAKHNQSFPLRLLATHLMMNQSLSLPERACTICNLLLDLHLIPGQLRVQPACKENEKQTHRGCTT